MNPRSDTQRRTVLLALLVITALSGILFCYINFHRGAMGIACAELFMGGASLALMPVVWRTRNLRFWSLVYIVPFFIVLLYSLTTRNASATVFIWALLPPILAHLLLGRWLGLLMSVVVMGGAAVIYFARFRASPELMEAAAVANVAVYGLTVLALSHAYEWSRERSESALRRSAATDALTGLSNRGEFVRIFEREQAVSLRDGSPLSLLLIDLDHFKVINDEHGHGGGDAVLVGIAAAITGCIRATDYAFRLGGEEFGVLLPGTDAHHARRIAERIRTAIERARVSYGPANIRCTASLGLAELGRDGDDLERLYGAADKRLYAGKAAGRNLIGDHDIRNAEEAFGS